MAKVIGLTGGIGSGKTTVAREFEKLGVPVYIADDAGSDILKDSEVIDLIGKAFGDHVIVGGKVSNKILGAIVFNAPEKLQQLNAIIHPRVFAHFKQWLSERNAFCYVIKEAAILFESGSYKQCDKVITVTAALETRISRVMTRDGVSREAVESRIRNQWTDERRIAHSDYVIDNSELESTHVQINKIHADLMNL